VHARLHYALDGAYKANGQPVGANLRVPLLLIEPDSTDAVLFMHNPASFAARRTILEYAYKTTRDRVARWIDANQPLVEVADPSALDVVFSLSPSDAGQVRPGQTGTISAGDRAEGEALGTVTVTGVALAVDSSSRSVAVSDESRC